MIRAAYKPLPVLSLTSNQCFVPESLNLASVAADSPASHVMTDLTRIPAASVVADANLTEANQAMIRRGVRMLFVTDSAHRLLGVITASDLSGERPLLHSQRHGLRHDELRVADIMTPVGQMESVAMDDVAHAEVGHIVATLKAAGRQHAIVIERDAQGHLVLRGVFSATQIARQLGAQVGTTEVARTFAEIEAVISAS